jgi:hypothetical protein
MTASDDLDRLIWGAEKIGAAAGLFLPNGSVDLDATYYKLKRGYLPAQKVGRQYVSTSRRIRDGLLNAPDAPEAA